LSAKDFSMTKRMFHAAVVGFMGLLAPSAAQAQWNPAKQYSYTQNQCRSARAAIDKDECQYNSESLIRNLRDCIKEGSPYARQCAQMLPSAQGFLSTVNRDPVLLNHRDNQRAAQRQYQDEQVRRGPSGILNYPNSNRSCYQLQNGQWNCQ
jgi:hypothetical protein